MIIQSVEKKQGNEATLFIIAAFNEGGMIKNVAQEIVQAGYSVLVIDDCSTDDTYDEALASGAMVAKHIINLGQGAALQTGIEIGINKKYKIMVTFDADGQHRLSDAVSMIRIIENNEADIVCGSRFLGVASVNMSVRKKLLLKMAAIFTRITTGVSVTDAHNGLRALSLNAAKEIRLRQNRMAHASELIGQIRKLRYVEAPVSVIYSEYSVAKGQRMSNSINILIDLFLGRF